MIFVDRTTIAAPQILQSDAAKNFLVENEGDIDRVRKASKIYLDIEVRQTLQSLFANKCAYCEQDLVSGTQEIEHFRPKSKAMDLLGHVSREHYSWLMLDWENLYLSCPMCNSMKGTRFPVLNNRLKPEELVENEHALLLDPTRDKDMEHHFVFHTGGSMRGNSYRGENTIDIIGLNRSELKLSRQQAWKKLQVAFDLIEKSDRENQLNLIKNLIVPSFQQNSPFLGMKRHLTKQFYPAQSLKEKLINEDYTLLLNGLNFDYENSASITRIKLNKEEKRHKKRQQSKKRSVEAELAKPDSDIDVSRSTDYNPKGYDYSSATWITKVEIKNFKNIKNMTLEFPERTLSPLAANETIQKLIQKNSNSDTSPIPSQSQPWLILLGENGVGKSSILQAIYLCLKGEQFSNKLCKELGISPKDFINRPREGKSAAVKVYLSNRVEPITLKISDSSKEDLFQIQPAKIAMNLLGYGSVRLLPKKRRDKEVDTNKYLDNVSLFDPYSPLNDGEKWLANPKEVNSESFKRFIEVIPVLLDIPLDTPIQRRNGKLKIKLDKAWLNLSELSDGYQSIVALALDMIMALSHNWKEIDLAEGIVLIDEIGVHLHPGWQKQIIGRLRRVFPRLRFVTSTHQPLCLTGARPKEIFVIRKDFQSRDITATPIDIPVGTRIDQLVTGDWFEVNTSLVDESSIRLLNLYSKSLTQAPDAPENKLLEEQLSKNLGLSKISPILDASQEALSELSSKEISSFNEGDKSELKDLFLKKFKEKKDNLNN